MEKPATIKDIARALQLSTSTVSRALRNAPDVNPETRQAVQQLSEELRYQPNRLAISLQQKHTHTIGVIAPNLDYMLSTMIKGIDEVALEAGYTVMVCQSNESYGRELVNTRRMMDSLVDGVIVSVSSETKAFDHLQQLLDKRIPVVTFDRGCRDITAPHARIDNYEGGFLATEHLLEQGYSRIAILAGPANLDISNNRLEGYLGALKKYQQKVHKELIVHCDFNQDYAYVATQELLSMKRRPDAIFTISDRMAIGAMLAIKEKKLRMPEDIGLVGFNNEPVTSLVTPGITSVDQPAFDLGKAAAKLFIEAANTKADLGPRVMTLRPKLVVRASSKRKEINTRR